MKVELTTKAYRQLKKLPHAEQKKVDRKLRLLLEEPHSGKKLTGKLEERYSFRAWPYRIIYVIIRAKSKVQVEIIEHRQGAYK